MEKKIYQAPLIEVEQIRLKGALLVGSPDPSLVPPFPHPAPSRGDVIP